jgi:hypothetical protein
MGGGSIPAFKNAWYNGYYIFAAIVCHLEVPAFKEIMLLAPAVVESRPGNIANNILRLYRLACSSVLSEYF